MSGEPSPLISRYMREIKLAGEAGPSLDLACGRGRNGLYLVKNKVAAVFADINEAALAAVDNTLSNREYRQYKGLATSWPVDFERADADPFGERKFGGIMVFRYLHRPLMEHIKQAVVPGGIVIYETFTVEQVRFGRPTNPDFLLRHNELQDVFSNWTVLYSFEGVEEQDNAAKTRAISQIVALKPG